MPHDTSPDRRSLRQFPDEGLAAVSIRGGVIDPVICVDVAGIGKARGDSPPATAGPPWHIAVNEARPWCRYEAGGLHMHQGRVPLSNVKSRR